MAWELTIYSLLTFVAAGIALLVALQAWTHRTEPAARSFTALMLALGGWSLAYAVQLGFTTLGEQLLWQAAGLAIGGHIPSLWILFVLQYSGRERWVTWRTKAFLAVDPLLFGALTLTNHYHGLVLQGATLPATTPHVVALSFGPGYYLHIAYGYLAVVAGLGLLALVFVRGSPLYRKQTGLLILGTLPAFATSIAFTLGWGLFPALDLTPFAFAITGALFGLALFRFDLLERTPVACQRALDEMGDGLVVLDTDGNVVETNATARRTLDLRTDGGQSITDLGLDATETADATLETIDGRTIATTAEGQQHAYDVICSPLTDLHGEPAGYVIILRDVTDRNEYRQRLEVAQRVLRHNLRNEMNVIRGRAEQIEETATDDQVRATEQIIDTADGLIELSEDVRTIVELDENAVGERIPVDVRDCLRAVLDEVRSDHPDVTVESEIPSAVEIDLPDEMFLEVVVTNLVRNAIEHNDARDPWVRVSVETGTDRVLIRIEDNGPEIPQMEREVIEKGTETPLYHGSGVGLWLAYWSVATVGGSIAFDTREPRGNVVTLEYPAAERPS
jgi:signal transduction histidine kinase